MAFAEKLTAGKPGQSLGKTARKPDCSERPPRRRIRYGVSPFASRIFAPAKIFVIYSGICKQKCANACKRFTIPAKRRQRKTRSPVWLRLQNEPPPRSSFAPRSLRRPPEAPLPLNFIHICLLSSVGRAPDC